jgi:hypothetical protein
MCELLKEDAGLRSHIEDNACEIWESAFKHFYSTSENRLDLILQLLRKKEISDWTVSQIHTVVHLLGEDEAFLFVNPVPGDSTPEEVLIVS